MINVMRKGELRGFRKLGDVIIIDTTARSGIYSKLSPFNLGPCKTYAGVARVFENLWQFSKVYQCHVDAFGFQNNDWYKWRARGWACRHAIRYPLGRNAKPLFAHWRAERLDYIQARKKIYAPEYAENVAKTDSYRRLERMYRGGLNILLLDFDAYDYQASGMTLVDVINNPQKKMGHAFVLVMMLTGELEKCIKSAGSAQLNLLEQAEWK